MEVGAGNQMLANYIIVRNVHSREANCGYLFVVSQMTVEIGPSRLNL